MVPPYLEGVVVCGRIFKQPVVRVEHLLGQQIEPLPKIVNNILQHLYSFLRKHRENRRQLRQNSYILQKTQQFHYRGEREF